MSQIEKTVFISYRRANFPWALAIYQDLTSHGYDVFFDYESIASGDFEQVILGNIKARAHFIVVLTPSALERTVEPGDWLRREIETALDTRRNIVPLMVEGFSFSSPSIKKYLRGKLGLLENYNALPIPAAFFQEAMERLRGRFLNVALEAVLHPLSDSVRQVTLEQQAEASKATTVREEELSAQAWFEKGYTQYEMGYLTEAMRSYSKAIRHKPDFAEAYNNRGSARFDQGDLEGAISDYDQAIRLKPNDADTYVNRGLVRKKIGDLEGAIGDYDLAIRLKPDYADAYYNRGLVRKKRGDLIGAIGDYDQAIRLKHGYTEAYYNRGLARYFKGDLMGAIDDYTEAIRPKPDFAVAYIAREKARIKRGNRKGARDDFDMAKRLGAK